MSGVLVAVPSLGVLCQITLYFLLRVHLLLDLLLVVLSIPLRVVLTTFFHGRRSEPQIASAATLRATNVNLVGRKAGMNANVSYRAAERKPYD